MAVENQLYRVETSILPRAKLLVVFAGLSFALLVSFIDQNSIGVILPTVGKDLDCANTIAWAGTSSLIANTVFQVLYGRLSDIFGRKGIFLSAVWLLALGDLLCSFAKTGPQLYGFRAMAGVAAGGIGAMSMTILSDILTLEQRGKYQGILGSFVGLGNVLGPFLAAGFIKTTTWRGLFWFICPLAFLAGIVVLLLLPPSNVTGDPKDKLKAIDIWGTIFSSIAIVLILIPVSGGGSYFEWSSPMVISMLSIGGVSAVLFIIVEWKVAVMPMMPLRLFRNRAVCAIFIQNFLFGIVYYSHLYYLPIYYQNTRGYSTMLSAALTIPFVAGQAVVSVLSGQYISRTKRYGEVIWAGYGLWTLGAGLVLLWDRHTPKWKIVIILLVEGAGVGSVFQPTLVAVQAHSHKHDRAVVISLRNFLRSMGGALGLAISATIFSNVLSKSLRNLATPLPVGMVLSIEKSTMSVPDLATLSEAQSNEILNAYMAASKGVFYLWVPLMAACLLLCLLVKDRGLTRPGEGDKAVEDKTNVETTVAACTDSQLQNEQPESASSEQGNNEDKGAQETTVRDLEKGVKA